jgi:hypothetical protein
VVARGRGIFQEESPRADHRLIADARAERAGVVADLHLIPDHAAGADEAALAERAVGTGDRAGRGGVPQADLLHGVQDLLHGQHVLGLQCGLHRPIEPRGLQSLREPGQDPGARFPEFIPRGRLPGDGQRFQATG